MPMVPNVGLGCVDVRDVAQCHIQALELGKHGQKYICSGRKQVYMFPEISQILKDKFGKKGYNPPTSVAPRCILVMLSICDKELKNVIPSINKEYSIDNTKSIEELRMTYIGIEQSLEEMVISMIEIGFIPDKRPREANQQESN